MNTLRDYKQFFDAVPVALVRTDIATGKFLMANKYAAEMLGYDNVDELLDKQLVTDLYPKEARKKLIDRLRTQGEVKELEIRLNLPSGKEVWVSANFHINCGGTCIEGALTDITQLVRLKQEHLAMMKTLGKQLDKRLAAWSA